jgi:hypothetical protein
MKRVWFNLLVLFLLVTLLAACGGEATEEAENAADTGETAATTNEGEVAEPAGSAVVRIGWGGSPDSLQSRPRCAL